MAPKKPVFRLLVYRGDNMRRNEERTAMEKKKIMHQKGMITGEEKT